jgi:signal transduction histidine kinase/DNA-binding response OmpR family regulator
MIKRDRYFEAELHVAPPLILAMMALVSWVLAFVFGLRIDALVVTLGLVGYLLLTAFVVMNTEHFPLIARGYAILSAILVVVILSTHPDLPGALMLFAIPVWLAYALMGLPAVAVTALIETGLAVGLGRRGGGGLLPTTWVALSGVWISTAVAAALAARVYGLYGWLEASFQRTQQLLDENLESKVRMAQTVEDLAHANRQLSLAHERMAAFRELAERAQQSKADFVAKVSHEFRTPLNMIIGLVDLLVETPDIYGRMLPQGLLKDLEIVHRNSEHLASMVNDILDLSQAESGYMTLHKENVDLGDMIAKAKTVVQPLLHNKGLSMHLEVPEDLEPVTCDPVRIRQVVLNLISNAARFTDAGGIVVRVIPKAASVQVDVEDSGPGIAPQDRDRIFEPFKQAEMMPTGPKGGTGLGLNLSKQFVELHGGRIWVESVLGEGSTFSFELPRQGPSTPVVTAGRWIQSEWEWLARSVPETPDEVYHSEGALPRVILCDPTDSLTLMTRHHADQAEIVQVSDLDRALEMLAGYPAHALIVNASTPDAMRSRVLEARKRVRDTPIVGCCVPEQNAEALSAGAWDYLVKPIRQGDLDRALRSLDRPVRDLLVVDDDPDLLDLIQRKFAMLNPEIHVTTASGGREGLVLLSEGSFDVVLLDIVMPEIDGWEFLRRKRDLPSRRDVPVILVTAQDPTDRPAVSESLTLAFQDGIGIGHILMTSLAFSSILLSPSKALPFAMPFTEEKMSETSSIFL